MAEFALLLPLLVLLVFGALEFGRAIHTKIVLTNAAREGAHFLIYDLTNPPNFNNTRAAVIQEAQNSGVTIIADNIIIQCTRLVSGVPIVDNNCPQGSMATITVNHSFNLLNIGMFTSAINMQSDAKMLVPHE